MPRVNKKAVINDANPADDTVNAIYEQYSEYAEPTEDGLTVVRHAVAVLRDLELERSTLQERLKETNKKISEQQFSNLPRIFEKYRVTHVALTADGNAPPCEARLIPYYRANILASWPEDRRNAAFAFLEAHNLGDMIKREITLSFRLGEDEEELFEQILDLLAEIDGALEHASIQKNVPWNTLTSWLREVYESGGELGDADLHRIGATVGSIVEIKTAKEK